MGVKYIWAPNIFEGLHNSWGPYEPPAPRHIFAPQIYVAPQIHLSPKYISPRIYLAPPNIFGPSYIWSPNIFGNQTYLATQIYSPPIPNILALAPKYIWPQPYLAAKYIWPPNTVGPRHIFAPPNGGGTSELKTIPIVMAGVWAGRSFNY